MISFEIYLPEIVLMLTALLVLFLGMIYKARKAIAYVAVFGLISVLGLLAGPGGGTELVSHFSFDTGLTSYTFDALALLAKAIITCLALLVSLASVPVFSRSRFQSEFYFFLLCGSAGAMSMAASGDLVLVFVSLELVALPAYIMTALNRDKQGSEASYKYIMQGLTASAIMVFGMSLIYGFAGSTNYYQLGAALSFAAAETGYFSFIYLGIVLVFAGFGLKIAVFPFHFWAPDVYENSLTPVTAFIAAVPKIGAYFALIRLFGGVFAGAGIDLTPFFYVLAVFSMTFGNLLALAQKNLKRMLAYSSVAHAGYMLMAFVAGTRDSYPALIYYVVFYVLANLLALFTAIAVFGDSEAEIKGLRGLSKKSPFMAACLTVAMMSLAGVPPMAGFFAKLYLFSAAVSSGLINLTVIAVVNSFISLGFYLRVVREAYFESFDPEKNEAKILPYASSPALLGPLAIVFILILLAFIFQAPLSSLTYLF